MQRSQKSIFSKYFGVCAGLILVSFIVLGGVFLVFASRYFQNDKYKLLNKNAQRASELLQTYYEDGELGETDIKIMQGVFGAMSESVNAQIFVTDVNGKVTYCTEMSPCSHTGVNISESVMKNLRNNREYSEMGKLGGVYSDMYYTVATPIEDIKGNVWGYVFVTSHASAELNSFLTEILKMFLISAVAVLAITFVAVYFVSMQMVKPLRDMARAAKKIGMGEFDTRLSVSSYDEMGQLAMALNSMAESLSTIEVARRSFTANISHELKTPMTTISGFIDGILDGTIPYEKQEYYLNIVSSEVKRMSRLVKTMLNLSRIEAGEMKINKSRVNIVDIACQAVFSFEQKIEAKNVDIRGLDHEKIMADADKDLIQQVIYNLTENAVKFVEEKGYIEYNFKNDGQNVTISIKNSGKGLSKEEIPKIFDRFYKSDRSRGLDKNGVGLGLYIVRSIVGLHDGNIMVKSNQGEFVEFIVTLPVSKPQYLFKKNS